ncbi:hypothetical protein HWV07_04325 [Natronomonas salina]|uniref:hypothetical protein n=1 Tax=Natronomonas salina TaxID=1710540 RepID=UPI0015B47F3F|nr:hypothetical protein [Natronomonas salina]QLD88300.1 hypothetical protein HWV07_04325 [Natronomonas salina]
MSGTNNTDQENSGETDDDGFDPASVAARMDERRDRRNAPLDLEDSGARRTAGEMRVVEAYEECLEHGLTEHAEALRDAETRSQQRKYASIIRGTGYEASVGELDENASEVRARYRDDIE